ncbi:hypothetical protein GCM10022393_38410 [Aquimarina addita]|uniref:Secreted protein n=1 Tax=Aquimarina addita TaxID=870485 RepID=A0ABP6UV60_9FLAO
MKTIYYTLIVLFMGANFISCTTDNITDTEEIQLEEFKTTGEDGEYEPEDEGGN